MFFKINKRNEKLQEKLNELILILEKSNLKELVYILGSKKEIIIRNILAGIFRGAGIGIRCNSSYSNNSLYAKKGSSFKYTCNRGIYC